MKVKIKDLIENPFSENRCSDEKLDQLREQYQNDGKFLELIEARPIDGKYQVIDGHQKLKILREKGVEETDIIVKEMTNLESLKYIGKKKTRGDMTEPFVQAARYKAMQCDMTQEDIAKNEGLSRARIANILRRLNIPEKYRTLMFASEHFHASIIDEISTLHTPKAFDNVIQWCSEFNRTKEEVRNYIHSREVEKFGMVEGYRRVR